ncbi:MAG: hypothetical protein LBH16_04110 [Treponema sp.]|jgi:hypothetical protein|nr:hypothetical protein [Treponema sp.]
MDIAYPAAAGILAANIAASTALLLCLIPCSLVYWCVDEKKGLRLNIIILISFWVNISIKFLFEQPGQLWQFWPFYRESDHVIGAAVENAVLSPSVAAQNTLVMLVITASWLRKGRFYVFSALLSVLIGIALFFIGRYSCADIAAGWICGGIIFCGYFLFSDKIESFAAAGGLRSGVICGAAVSFLMILFPEGKESIMTGGLLFGIILGYCLNRRYINFRSACLMQEKNACGFIMPARFVLGMAVLVLILFRVEKIIPQISSSQNIKLYIFLCYLLTGLWVSVAAPWVFIKLRLAGAPPEEQ